MIYLNKFNMDSRLSFSTHINVVVNEEKLPLSSDNILKSIKYLKSKKFNRETIVENITKNCQIDSVSDLLRGVVNEYLDMKEKSCFERHFKCF